MLKHCQGSHTYNSGGKSLGVISLESFQNLYKALKAPTAKDCCKVKAELVKTTLSFGVEKLEGVVLGL